MTTTTTAPAATTGKRRNLVLAVSCSSLFLASLDSTAVTVALPDLQRDLGLDLVALQWVVTAAALARGASLFPAGLLADRFGARRVFGVGVLVFAAASGACALAPSLWPLVVARAVQGIGGALMTPSSIAMLTLTFTDPRQRAQALGFWSASAGMSTAIGPLLGGVLVAVAGWRGVFLLCLPFAALVLGGLLLTPRDRPSGRVRRFDVAGLTLLGAAMVLVTYALSASARYNWASPWVLMPLAGAAAAVWGFRVVERRASEPVLAPGTFARPLLRGAALVAGLAYLCLAGMSFVNSLYLQQVRGLEPLAAGLMSLPLTVTTMAAALISGRWLGRSGPRPPVLLGVAMLTAALVVLALTTTVTGPLWPLLVGFFLMGCGMGLTNPPATASAVASLEPARSGTASAITSVSRQLGTNIGVAALGAVTVTVAAAMTGTSLPSAVTDPHAFTVGIRVAYATTALVAGVAWFAAGRLFRDSRPGPDPPAPGGS